MAMTPITKTFYSRDEAEKAFSQLEMKGVPSSNIGMITTDTTREKMFGEVTTEDRLDSAAKGAGTGAAIGGTLTAVVAGLTAVGAVAVPGAGLLASGPIVALLAGGGAGAAAGGLAGALIGAGIPEDEAKEFESDTDTVMVTVHPQTEAQAQAARAVLRS